MRKGPFIDTEDVAEAPAGQPNNDVYESRRVSLLDRLTSSAKKSTPEPETKKPEVDTVIEEDNTSADDKGKSAGDSGSAPKTESDFEEFENKVHEKLKETDAIEIAEMVVQVGNIGRMVFLPGMYEGFMYPGQERNDIRDVIRRSIENEKAGKARDDGFNPYDKRLFAKWDKLQEAIQNVSFTEPEMKTFAKYLAREISDMTVSVWMQKHMWLLYWLYLESKHAKAIIGGRANDFFQKKFGG